MVSDRGQAHTLEAIVAALLLLSSVIFALQITAVTPLSASTSNQHIENQQQASAEGVLSMAAESGALREAVLYWNASGERFHGGIANGYYTDTMPTEFGRILERSFGERGIAYNVYITSFGTTEREEMIYHGEPSDNAVTARRTVVLSDDTRLLQPDFTKGRTLNGTNFYVPDISEQGYYNSIRVEVVVWRI